MKFRPFEELFEIPLRNGLTKPKRVRGDGYKMVNMGELFRFPRMKNIPMDRVPLNEKEQASSMVEAGDLLFARQSLVLEGAGQCSIFMEDDEEVCFESHLIRCRLNKEIANPLFYYYFFSSRTGKLVINAIVEQGAGAAGVRGSDLSKVLVPDVDIVYQNKVAEVFDQIDSKIELNRQTNQTLEQIAQAIFKSWFVDFDPVKAKIQAKQNGQDPERAAMCAISGKSLEELEQLEAKESANIAGGTTPVTTSPSTFEQLKTTAALFPDALVESELGEIPEGWDVTRFKQIVEKYIDNRGKTPPVVDSGIPLVEVKHLPEGMMKPDLNTTKYVDDETYKNWFRAHLEADDIIISTVGTIGRICMVPKDDKFTIAQNLLGMRFNKEKASPYFMYYQMDGFRFRHDVDARLIVTVQASIKRKDLETIDLLSPPIELQNVFEEFVKPFVVMQQSNQEIQLSYYRDALLPKLLSGEINLNNKQNKAVA